MIVLFCAVLYAQEDVPPMLRIAKEQSSSLGLNQRIEIISESLLGIPYLLDPEGEAAGFDQDPLQNFSHMDCLTYVEAVLSLSMTETWDETLEVRNDLRYLENEVHYDNRKHFMFSQWIPNNIELGYIQNISSQIASTHRFLRTFDDQLWKYWSGKKKIPLSDEAFPIGEFGLDVLSIDDALAHIDRIPSGSLLVVVRDSNKGNPVLISHIGFVIDRKTKWGTTKKMRHATILGKPKGVKEHDLRWYLNHMKDYPYRWKVRGISIFHPKYPNEEGVLLEPQKKEESVQENIDNPIQDVE
jgi:hypothetical protein